MTISEVKEKFNNVFSSDFDFRVATGKVGDSDAAFFYIEGMIDKELLSMIMKSLAKVERPERENVENCASPAEIKVIEDFDEAVKSVVNSSVVMFFNEGFYEIPIVKFEKRSIQEPPTSSVIKGPRAGFVEDISINTTLLRRRLKSERLRIKSLTVGKYTTTTVCVCYIEGIAKQKIVDTVTERISSVKIDGIIDSEYIAELIEDNKSSIFPQTASQEKPDVVTAKLLEGRIAIIVDGSPMVLTLPHLLLENFQDGDDYYKRKHRASFTRILRLLGLFMATLLPALYVAVQEYQYQLIPLKFMITVINATNGTPLSPAFEMFLVLILFDVLNEASVRMPKYVGMALSIVGAIVLGETAVSAGLLSSPSVLIMALSAIGMYTSPNNIGTFTLIRLLLLALASVFGICGVLTGIFVFVAHIANLKSFDVDYTAPYSPVVISDLKDGFVKGSLSSMKTRPRSIPNDDPVRQK